MAEAAALSLAQGKHEPGTAVQLRFFPKAPGDGDEAVVPIRWEKAPERAAWLSRDLQRRTQLAAEATGLVLALCLWDAVAVEESAKANGWDYKLVDRAHDAELIPDGARTIHLELSGIDALTKSESAAARAAEKRLRFETVYPASLPAVVIVTDFHQPLMRIDYVEPCL